MEPILKVPFQEVVGPETDHHRLIHSQVSSSKQLVFQKLEVAWRE